jgi:hypothetical protein
MSNELTYFVNVKGIYRNAQHHEVEESFSPKVKSMIDLFNNGKTKKIDRVSALY